MGDQSFVAALNTIVAWAATDFRHALATLLAATVLAVVPAAIVYHQLERRDHEPKDIDLGTALVCGLLVALLGIVLPAVARAFIFRYAVAPFVIALMFWWLIATLAILFDASRAFAGGIGWLFPVTAAVLQLAAGVSRAATGSEAGTFGARWAQELERWPVFMFAAFLPVFLLLSLRELPGRWSSEKLLPWPLAFLVGVGLSGGLTVLPALGLPREVALVAPLMIGLCVLRAIQLSASPASAADPVRALVAKTKGTGIYRRRTAAERAEAAKFLERRAAPGAAWAEVLDDADRDAQRTTLLAAILPALERQGAAGHTGSGRELVAARLLALRGRADLFHLAAALRVWGAQTEAFALLREGFTKDRNTKALDALVAAGTAAGDQLLQIARTSGSDDGRLKAAEGIRWAGGLSPDDLGALACLSPKGAVAALSALLALDKPPRAVLVTIAKRANRSDVRIAAARALADRDILIELACANIPEAPEAFRDLNHGGQADRAALMKIARGAHHGSVRLEAARMANDQEALIALACEDSKLAPDAFAEVDEVPAALAEIARNARRLDVRFAAAKMGQDRDALLALSCEDTDTAAAAFTALKAHPRTDHATLAAVADNAKRGAIRFEAAMAVGGVTALAAIVRQQDKESAKALDALIAIAQYGKGGDPAKATSELKQLVATSRGDVLKRIIAALPPADVDAALPVLMRGKTGRDAWDLIEARERHRGSAIVSDLVDLAKASEKSIDNAVRTRLVDFVEANPDLAAWVAQAVFSQYGNRAVLDECIKRPGRGTGLFIFGYFCHQVDFGHTKPKRAPYPVLVPHIEHILPELEGAMTSGTSNAKKLAIKSLIAASRELSTAAEGALRHKVEFKRTRSLGRARTAYDEVLSRWKDSRVAGRLADLDERKHYKWAWR